MQNELEATILQPKHDKIRFDTFIFSDKSRFSNAVYFSLHLLVRTNKQLQLNKICFSVGVVLIHYMTGAVAGDSWNHAKTCQFYFRVALATSLKLVTCWRLSQTLSELQQRSFEGSKFTKDSCACEIQCTTYLFSGVGMHVGFFVFFVKKGWKQLEMINIRCILMYECWNSRSTHTFQHPELLGGLCSRFKTACVKCQLSVQ